MRLKMKALSIKFTVIAAICGLGAVALAQGAGGWFSINQIRGNFEYIAGNVTPSLQSIGEIRQATLMASAILGEEVLAATTDERAAIDKKLQTAIASADKLLDGYKSMLAGDEDQATYDVVMTGWQAWKSAAAPIQKSALSGDMVGAVAGFNNQSAAAETLGEVIAAMSANKLSTSNDALSTTRTVIADSQLGALILDAVTVLAVAAALFVMLTRVLRPLGQITGAMRRIADNELGTEVPGIKRKDEVGAMAQAVEVFRESGLKIRALGEEERASAELAAARAAEGDVMGQNLTEAVTAAAHGDFTRRVPTNYGQDSLNSVAGIVNNLLETVERGLAETGEVLSAVAHTDLTRRVEGDYEGSFLRLKQDTNAVADKLTEIVGQLKHTSGSLKLATGEILSGANDLSERTTKQAATIEETSAAMEQLAHTVQNNAKRAGEASQVAGTVTRTAEEGGQVMTAANQAMERITQSSAKISNIIGLIDDIAFQTNLLALNASVEAARAGEAGKGFAVVAVEVRRLAQSAAEASSEVKVLIEQSGTEVTSGSKLVADAAQKLTAMLQAARSSNDLMDGIARDSQEQASAIEEVSTAVRQMDEMTQHNAALVEEINAAIEQTESQATDLDRIVDVFALEEVGTEPAIQQARPKPVEAKAAPAPAPVNPRGVKAMQERVKRAARSYLTRGSNVIKEDWSEF
jgi:methyl-accepting chemotaxis protein